jgi:hypothetical protein
LAFSTIGYILKTSNTAMVQILSIALFCKLGKIPSLQNKAMLKITQLLITEPSPPTQDKDEALHQFLAHAYATKEDTVLKKMAVYVMLQVLPTMVSLKEWVVDFFWRVS